MCHAAAREFYQKFLLSTSRLLELLIWATNSFSEHIIADGPIVTYHVVPYVVVGFGPC